MQDTILHVGDPSEVEPRTFDYSAGLPVSALDTSMIGLNFVNIAQENTWQKSPVPLWSSILSSLKSYEAEYHILSSTMYDGYLSRNLSVHIDSQDLRDWVDSYLLYGK